MKNDLLSKNPITIVDVGASGGVNPRWDIFKPYYKAVLFEPDSREYDILSKRIGSNIILLNTPLSDSEKELEFYLCKKQEVSSFYSPNFELLSKFPYADRFQIMDIVKLKTDTLDNQLSKINEQFVDFIKIDAQGFELNILRGSEEILQNVIGLEIEVAFIQLYKDQPLFADINNFVFDHGFVLYDLKRYYWKRTHFGNSQKKGQLVFADALYLRDPESLMKNISIQIEQIIRVIYIYIAYGYSDLASTLIDIAMKRGILSNNLAEELFLYINNFENIIRIPNFKGMYKIHQTIEKIERFFDEKGPYSGSDKRLGGK